MLIKELCIKCGDDNPDFKIEEPRFTENWNGDCIFCPYAFDDNFVVAPSGVPPIKCPYRLEHLMIRDKRDAESRNLQKVSDNS